ncbi:MAG TPA: CsbD family protein [Candidatus Binatia bacterium]|nr:CsbD family protein [Candidatus Binatia bacterium]
MNWDVIKGKWKQMQGEARKQWGKLTDDDWTTIGGEKDKFLGKLQERYGWSKDEAERSADEYFSRMS